jgi:hypothetical protein
MRYQSFAAGRAKFLETRFTASHILLTILSDSPDGDDESLQMLWAKENGLQAGSLDHILMAQIEHHRTEVFYILDRYDTSACL